MLLRSRVRDRLHQASSDTTLANAGRVAALDTVDVESHVAGCSPVLQGVHSIYEACMNDEMRAVLAAGIALLLFLVLFAFGQLQEIFRATGYH